MRERSIRCFLAAAVALCVGGLGVAHADDDTGVGPFTKNTYPTDMIDRPLTLVGGMVELGLGLSHQRFSVAGMGDTSVTAAGFGAAYGLGDKIQVGVSTGLTIDPDFDWSENLGVSIGYLAVDQKSLDVRPGVSTQLSFADGADAFNGFELDAFTRLLLNKSIAITAGQGLLAVRTSDPSAVDLNLRVGVLAQVVSKLAVTLNSEVASLAVSGDGNETTHWGDRVPLDLAVYYSPNNKLDVGLLLSFSSVDAAGDDYTLGLAAAFRM